MRASLLAAVLCGCGSVHFTDPDAPVLFHSTSEYKAGGIAEPLVWMPILDVFAASPDACAVAHDWMLRGIRNAMLAADPKARELPGTDLSPDCAQSPGRNIDVAALQQQVDSAVAAYPGAHVRVAM